MMFSLNRACLSAGLIAATLLSANAAMAQNAGRRLSDQECACIDLAIKDGRREISLRKTAYEEQDRSVKRMEKELALLKPKVDTENQASVDAYRMKLDEFEAARDILQTNTLPDYQTTVAAYNENLVLKEKRCPPVTYDEATVQRNFPGLVCRR